MSSGSSASFFLIVCFLVGYSEALENITAELGQNVNLPCKVPNNKPITALEWSRPGLKPDDYVLFYRDGHFDPVRQHRYYKNRVDLKDREMKDGDVSLILKNVKMEDEGTYQCQVFQRGTNHRKRFILKTDPINIINLEVLPPGDKDGGDKDGGGKTGIIAGSVVGGLILLLVLASVIFLIYKKNVRSKILKPVPLDDEAGKNTPHPIVAAPSPQTLEVQRCRTWSVSGQETVREDQEACVKKCESEWLIDLIDREADGADWQPHLCQSAPGLHM